MDPKNMKPQPLHCVAFAVVQVGNTFTPTRLEIEGGVVREAKACGPAGPYRPLAFQYLAGAVQSFYHSLALKQVHDESK